VEVVTLSDTPPAQAATDAVAVGVWAGEEPEDDAAGGAVAELVRTGEARTALRKLAHTHAQGVRWIVAGLGARDEWDAEHARVTAALVAARARELGARSLAWVPPEGAGDPRETAGALVEGTVLAAYRFDRYKRRGEDEGGLERLVILGPAQVGAAVDAARVVSEAANAARDLQNTPANDLTPTVLAERAVALGEEIDGLQVTVEGPEALRERGMGAFLAVAQGSVQEPRLITLRSKPEGATGPVLGYVGKAVTFDSGGISIKPSAKMHEMKFDMSGGAAVLEAVAAVARLGLPVRMVGVIGATENMPSGGAVKPGDIVRAMDGTTIEVNNTDAEGRMVLADCLCWAREQGAERLVDVATLTGAILVALGSTHAGLMSCDDSWAAEVEGAARATGELAWRLPLHPEYAEMIKGRYGEIVNATEARKAGSITAAHFLERFAGDVPWAHLDIAGTAWDLGRPYASKGGSGFGVRLLVELARRVAAGTGTVTG
jgi:leucyl aminopeptidase